MSDYKTKKFVDRIRENKKQYIDNNENKREISKGRDYPVFSLISLIILLLLDIIYIVYTACFLHIILMFFAAVILMGQLWLPFLFLIHFVVLVAATRIAAKKHKSWKSVVFISLTIIYSICVIAFVWYKIT